MENKEKEQKENAEPDIVPKLIKKIRDLEIFNRMMIGRELKMVKLKKKIARLEEQLKRKKETEDKQ